MMPHNRTAENETADGGVPRIVGRICPNSVNLQHEDTPQVCQESKAGANALRSSELSSLGRLLQDGSSSL